MSDVEVGRRRIQGRSPLFPFISLEKAIAQAKKLERHSNGHPVRVATAVEAWGYKEASSGGLQTVGALKAFGLLSDVGSKDERKVQLTELGKRLARTPPAGVLEGLLKEAALKPRAIREFWELWGAYRPPDSNWGAYRPPDSDCRYALTTEKGFTDAAAVTFLSVYDATIAFAGLDKSDIVSDAAEDVMAAQPERKEDEPKIAPGDLVQWVSQDVWQFEHPRRVQRVVDNPRWGKFVSVEGYDGMLPLEQLELMEKMRHADSLPNNAASSSEPSARPPNPQPLVRRHVFALESGHAALELPTDLSTDVLEDIKAWLVVMVRRAGKSAKRTEQGNDAEGGQGGVQDLTDALFPEQERRLHN